MFPIGSKVARLPPSYALVLGVHLNVEFVWRSSRMVQVWISFRHSRIRIPAKPRPPPLPPSPVGPGHFRLHLHVHYHYQCPIFSLRLQYYYLPAPLTYMISLLSRSNMHGLKDPVWYKRKCKALDICCLPVAGLSMSVPNWPWRFMATPPIYTMARLSALPADPPIFLVSKSANIYC